MKRLIAIFLMLFVGVARAAVVNDLAGPTDYGATVTPASYTLAGATVGDTRQGVLINDCFVEAVIGSILHQNPSALAKNYQVRSDGNVNVTFFDNGLPITYDVTPAVNWFWGDATTSLDDSNGNAATAIILKAYADFRSPSNTMADLNFGFPSEVMAALGLSAGTIPSDVADIAKAFNAGDVVAVDTGFLTPPGGVEDHSYSVWAINTDGTIVLRSPWGDGYEGRGINEFLTVNNAWLSTYSDGVFAGLFGGAAPVPEPYSIAFALPAVAMLMKRHRRAA